MAQKLRELLAEIKTASRDEAYEIMQRYADDPRVGVQKALVQLKNRVVKEEQEEARVHAMYTFMHESANCDGVPEPIIIGIDEVGRGSIAGPLTVGAVALPDKPEIKLLNDSKQLSAAQRELVATQIKEVALGIGIYHVAPERIDEIGMAQALREAMLGALSVVGITPDAVLIDGNPMHLHKHEKTIVKGDGKVAAIAAASIVAKVTRDAMMVEYDKLYPEYDFASNKGYASQKHIEMIGEIGLCPIHRVSFCHNFVKNLQLF